jgi:cytochrome o ubiquinol oxidase subunit 2
VAINKAKRKKRIVIALLAGAGLGIAVGYLHTKNFQVLNPAGMVAVKQRNLLILVLLLSAIVVIPVFTMTFLFAWKYREGNHKHRGKYSPEMDGNKFFEMLWWGIPMAIIAVLSVVTWNSSHSMDPRKPLDVAAKPLTVQVVALDWKWLFIYPEQNVASVNYLKLPVGTPVNFKITSDAPMNAFWIPQLGSQVYAMTGMSTNLHLIADKAGDYHGYSSNISGEGFADMHFMANAVPTAEFNKWVNDMPLMGPPLTNDEYQQLRKPNVPAKPLYFSSVTPGLYDKVVQKYMGPQ